MPAGCVKLVLHIQGAQVRVHHQQVLLLQAEAAGVRGGAEAGRPLDEGPADLVPPPLLLEVPDVLAEARVLPLGDVVEAGSVVVAPGLPGWFCPAQVGLHPLKPRVDHLVLQLGSLGGEGFDLGLVDNIGGKALAVQWAGWLVLLRAAALLLLLRHLTLANDLGVVVGYDAPEGRQGPIADLDRCSVEGLVARVTHWEAHVQDLEEALADVGRHGPAEWRIKPADISFSPPPPPPPLLVQLWLELQLLLVSSSQQLLLVQALRRVEQVLAGRVGRQALVDTGGDALGHRRWMVGLLVHIEGHMVGLGEVPIGGVDQVEGDVEERDDLLVHNDGDAEAVGLEDVRDLLLESLVLLGLQGAHPEAIVAVQADVGWQVLELGEQEQADDVRALGAVVASHGDVEAGLAFLHPGCAPVKEDGVLDLVVELPVVLGDGDQL